MTKEERQQCILQVIQQAEDQHLVGTRELAEQFGVSEMTVRRDLQELSEGGLLQRQHGGATPIPPRRREPISKEIAFVRVSKTGKFSDPFFNAVMEGADYKLQELGYRLAFINSQAQLDTAEQARELLDLYPVDGVILIGFVTGEGASYIRENVRTVIQTTEDLLPDVDTISFDGFGGMRSMVDHLVSMGYKRLGFITGQHDSREQGFMDGVKAHHLPRESDLFLMLPYGLDGWTPEMGHIGAQRLMALRNPPDAIVCASDRIAIGAIQWLHQHGYHVPMDIAVTGFDNIPESQFTAPPLTTVHVHKQLMGELAAERAVKRIENENAVPLIIQTPTHLVIRQSCGHKE